MAHNNFVYDKHGPMCADLGQSWSSALPGDYIVNNAWGHVMLISSITDLNKNGIQDYAHIVICAHTYHQKDKPLSALWPDTNCRVVWVYGYWN